MMAELDHREYHGTHNSQPLLGQTTSPILQIPTVPQRMVYPDLKVDGCTYSGILHIVIGTLSLCFGSVSVAVYCYMTSVGWPFWGGAFFFATGLVGCRVAKRVSQGTHTALILYAALVTFSGVIASNMLVAVCQAAMNEEEPATDGSKVVTSSKSVRVAIDCVFVFLSSAEIFTSLWAGIVAFTAIHKRNKYQRMLTTQPVITTYGTVSSTAILSSPYPGMGYLPIDTGPPPKYEAIPPKADTQSDNDSTNARET